MSRSSPLPSSASPSRLTWRAQPRRPPFPRRRRRAAAALLSTGSRGRAAEPSPPSAARAATAGARPSESACSARSPASASAAAPRGREAAPGSVREGRKGVRKGVGWVSGGCRKGVASRKVAAPSPARPPRGVPGSERARAEPATALPPIASAKSGRRAQRAARCVSTPRLASAPSSAHQCYSA